MTSESEPSGPKPLERGTKVRLKQTIIGESLGIKPKALRGGEAVVNDHTVDSKGQIAYRVTLLRNGKSRTVYRDDLIVHQKSNKKHYGRPSR